MFTDDEIGGPVIDALIRAHQRGIKVRVLIDHLGNFGFNKPVFTKLREAGVVVREMLPVRVFDNEWSRLDLRHHRKIVVVDGTSDFTGSQNLINSTYNKAQNIKKGLYYEELVTRVTGLIVIQLESVFAADWYSETDQVLTRDNYAELATEWRAVGDVHVQALPSDPGQEKENNWLLFNALFHQAQEKIVISTPYFVPDVILRGDCRLRIPEQMELEYIIHLSFIARIARPQSRSGHHCLPLVSICLITMFLIQVPSLAIRMHAICTVSTRRKDATSDEGSSLCRMLGRLTSILSHQNALRIKVNAYLPLPVMEEFLRAKEGVQCLVGQCTYVELRSTKLP